ncbi:MAG: PaaI family thioesterase [Polyangiales bacterium]
MNDETPDIKRPWLPAPPGRLFGRGHPVAEFLEAYDWSVLAHEPGSYALEAHLPQQVKNPRGQMFGGFAPTYIDLVAVRTAHSVLGDGPRGMATVNMRVDYFEPVADARFRLKSRVINTRGKTHLVEVLLEDLAGKLLVFSIVTLRQR